MENLKERLIDTKLLKGFGSLTFEPQNFIREGFTDVIFKGERIAIINANNQPLQWMENTKVSIPELVKIYLERFCKDNEITKPKGNKVFKLYCSHFGYLHIGGGENQQDFYDFTKAISELHYAIKEYWDSVENKSMLSKELLKAIWSVEYVNLEKDCNDKNRSVNMYKISTKRAVKLLKRNELI